VLSLLVADNDQQTVLVATENGFGKRTALADFRHSGRGTQGVIAIAASERNGKVVAARLVRDDDEIMLITTGGVLIRTRVREIRELGRATQGVTLIALDAGEKLAGLEKVVESEDDVELNLAGRGGRHAAAELPGDRCLVGRMLRRVRRTAVPCRRSGRDCCG
jgi:DNA gyrase subunit A